MTTFKNFVAINCIKNNNNINKNTKYKPIITFLILHLTWNIVATQLYEGSECVLYDGGIGTCKAFEECKTTLDEFNRGIIQYNQIQATRCSFRGVTEIICCADERHTLVRHTTKPPIDDGEDDVHFLDDAVINDAIYTNKTLPSLTFFNPNSELISVVDHTNKSNTFERLQNVPITHHKSIIDTATIFNGTHINNIQNFFRNLTIEPFFSIFKQPTSTTITPPQRTTSRATKITSPRTTKNIFIPWFITNNKNNNNSIRIPPTTVRKTATTTESFWSIWSPLRTPPAEYATASLILETSTKPFTTLPSQSNTFSLSPITNNNNNVTNKTAVTLLDPWMAQILQEMQNSSINNSSQNSFRSINSFNTDITDDDGGGSSDDDYFYNIYRDRETQHASSMETITMTDTVTRPSTRAGDSKTELACANYSGLAVPLLSFHILGGTESKLGEFPHMAALGFASEQGGQNDYAFNCGGTIINDRYILTAAHCVNARDSTPTIARMGQVNLLANAADEPFIDRTIEQIISHPNYHPSRKYDDIAIIRVSPPIDFNESIRPACLRTNMSDIDSSTQLIVTGWGSTSIERNQRSNLLLKTNLTAVPLDQCNSSLLEYNPNNRALRNGVNLGQICAKDSTGTNDACQGDSGGPIQIVRGDGVSTVVGITSFGISCGSALPSVYTRVAFYIQWIESIAWSDS